MFKTFTLAIVATVALAMPHDFAVDPAEIPVHAEFPLPVVPWDFEASSYTYIWANSRLAPANQWRTSRFSSTLNMYFDSEGIINDEGDEQVTSSEATDATRKTAVEYTDGKGCVNADGVQIDNVNQTLATFFDTFTYAGLQYAPWELTRVKYHRLDSQSGNIQFYYKQSNQQIRFFVELLNDGTQRVHDFSAGLVAKTFTKQDFAVTQCLF